MNLSSVSLTLVHWAERLCFAIFARSQTVLPHPVSVFQVLSYAGVMFFNITLDTRSATSAWLLRDSFTDAVDNVATWSGVRSKWSPELNALGSSVEWGGKNIVYCCREE